jgi:flagellar hook-length control protein FliK
MPVETISQTQKEAANGKAHGLARNALGWINRIINESVQEISDFSALLSAQSAEQATSGKALGAKEVSLNPEDPIVPEKAICNVEKSPIQTPSGKEILLPDRAKAFGLREESPHGQSKDKPSSEEPDSIEVQSDQDLESEIAPDPAVILDSEESSESAAVEVLVEQPQTPNTLAAELLSSQLLVSQITVASEEVEPVQANTAEVEVLADPVLSSTSEPVSAALVQSAPEELPASVEKGLLEFARKAMQKPESVEAKDVKSQSPSSNNPVDIAVKNADVGAQVTQKGQTSDIGFELRAQTTQDLMAAPSKGTQSSAPSLSQSFVNTWTANYAQAGVNQEDSGRPGIEALSGSKFGSILNKSASETGSSAAQQSAKGIDIKVSTIDTSAVVSFSSNNGEGANRSESSKSLKPLTRIQTLATLEKVEAALQKAAESKDGTLISLRLDPPSLGAVRVDVSFKDGLLHARLSADSAQVMQLLRERAPELQVTLRKLGLDVDRVSVSVNSGDSGTFQGDSEGKGGHAGHKSGNNFSELADFAASGESLKLDHWIA